MSDRIKGSEGTVREDILLKADDALKQRILERVGKTEGIVRIEQAEWDLGYCDTCSWPEEGLAVYVDGEQVWPNPDVIALIGGNRIGDDATHYSDGVVEVTQYSLFYDWLLGATPEELDEIEAKAWEGDDDAFVLGAAWQREQLLTDDVIERAAMSILLRNYPGCTPDEARRLAGASGVDDARNKARTALTVAIGDQE